MLEGVFPSLVSFSNHHIQVFCDQERFQSTDMQLSVSRGGRSPPPRIRLNWLPTILCHISPTLQTSKRLLNCDQMTITNMMQWLPPKDSICQQACSAVSRSPRAGIRFPTTPRDIPRADFHLVVTACTIAHSLI